MDEVPSIWALQSQQKQLNKNKAGGSIYASRIFFSGAAYWHPDSIFREVEIFLTRLVNKLYVKFSCYIMAMRNSSIKSLTLSYKHV